MASADVIEIGAAPTPIAAALGRALERQLPATDHPVSVSMAIVWLDALIKDLAPVARPIALIPWTPIDPKSDLDDTDPGSLVSKIQEAITHWRTSTDQPVASVGDAVTFEVALLTSPGAPRPPVLLRYVVKPG